jgi:putative salt-induced outer membrane protein
MTDTRLWASVAAVALVAAWSGAAQAQTTAFEIEDATTDVVEEIEEDVDDDFDRDLDPFGNEGRELGFSGSIAARVTATSGNDETTDIGLAGRMNYFDGVNGAEVNLAFTFTEDRDFFDPESGTTVAASETNLFFSTQYTRELTSNLYGFVNGVAVYDDNDEALLDPREDDPEGSREDIFVGGGLGYRIANSERLQWSVQAGPGYRWREDFDGVRTEETAVSLSSDLLYQFTPTVAVTNDTDIIASDDATTATNDLALTVALNESLSLRTSLLTEYDDNPGGNAEEVDNTLGAAVVFNF